MLKIPYFFDYASVLKDDMFSTDIRFYFVSFRDFPRSFRALRVKCLTLFFIRLY
jgi:hypothetical protein